MKIYDVSMDIFPEMAVWKDRDERRPVFEITRDHAKGDPARETKVTLDMHTGTHIDAPLHFVPNGETMEFYPLDRCIQNVRVLDLTTVADSIGAEDLLPSNIKENEFLLFKTRNSLREDFDMDFVFLDHTGAALLKDIGVQGVGTDALGIERSQDDHATHKNLLGSGIMIIEGLRLAQVEPGTYQMIAAPLKIRGVEAAPARVLLLDTRL